MAGGLIAGLRRDMAGEACGLVQEVVSIVFDVPLAEIRRANRCQSRICDARHVAMYLANTTFGISLSRVARAFGRERTTVAHAVRRVEDKRDDQSFDARLERLEALLAAIGRAIEVGRTGRAAVGGGR
ncbi:hypothetical protein LQ948_10445 [Jiella sp. MQZ9-1]|uniref:Chromosomal replication initiator DnaA C-terminal domain-containing protein n=1 Tax=Jiella flava TaxID=2816857 RepID=A0A939JRY4_9HYPH|nr:helix-turn-helix domain-containing protein [Jiella flava]MBO0662403.1 hypothetical protein [Jiella flava]MCD2471627.1 hypothetical protein [Jiella flava]